MPDQYLSTDPNAGQPVQASGGYLSTDPNAGEAVETTEARPSRGSTTAAVGAGLLAAKAAPGVVAGIKSLANVGGKVAGSKFGSVTPAVIAMDAAMDVARGDLKGAATSAAGAAAASQIPKVLGVIERAASPSVGLLRGPAGRFLAGSGRAGLLMRGAQGLSRFAGRFAAPLAIGSLVWDTASDLSDYANDPNTSPEVREAMFKVLAGGGY